MVAARRPGIELDHGHRPVPVSSATRFHHRSPQAACSRHARRCRSRCALLQPRCAAGPLRGLASLCSRRDPVLVARPGPGPRRGAARRSNASTRHHRERDACTLPDPPARQRPDPGVAHGRSRSPDDHLSNDAPPDRAPARTTGRLRRLRGRRQRSGPAAGSALLRMAAARGDRCRCTRLARRSSRGPARRCHERAPRELSVCPIRGGRSSLCRSRSPFELQLQLRRLGVVLHGYSTSAISAGVQRQRA